MRIINIIDQDIKMVFYFRWSDGTMTLHLGNEIFDVHKQPLQGDFNHMFIRQVCTIAIVGRFLVEALNQSARFVTGPSIN